VTSYTIPQISRTRLSLLFISYLMFILLGLTDTLRDVAFPSIRAEYNLPLNAISSLLIVGTIGYGAASFYTGKLVAQMGLGRVLVSSAALRAAGGIAFALVPSWELTLVAVFLIGVGGGLMDTGGNIYIAENHGPTIMFWLHASFGIGATLGPLLMTSILGLDQSWRLGYGIVGAVNLLLMIVFITTLPYWKRKPKAQENEVREEQTNREALSKTLTLPMVWVSIGI
jgi:MFS family permease